MIFPIFSINDHLAEGSLISFQQGEFIKVILAKEASNLTGAMLEQLSARKLVTEEHKGETQELAEHNEELEKQTEELEKQNTDLEEWTKRA